MNEQIEAYLCPYCAQESYIKDDTEKFEGSWFIKEELAQHVHIAHGHRLRDIEVLLKEWSGIGLLEKKSIEKPTGWRL